VRIRDLAWEDFPSLTEGYLALYDEVRTDPDLGISLFPERPTIGAEVTWFAGLYKAVLDGSAVAVVAEEEGRAVGLCDVKPKGVQESRHVGVLGILVERRRRGHGLGRALLEGAIERSRGKFEIVELAVFASNSRARRLYESVGFRAWGTLPKEILRDGRRLDVDHMFLELA
jgi:RimJ/RimL family protein N-acetyltransferase